MLTDIAGRGSRCPDSMDLSPPHHAALITEHRGRAYASPFSPFVKGFACFSLLNKLTEGYSVVLAGRELAPVAALAFTALCELVCMAVHDKGHALPTEPWRQRVPGEEILEVRKIMTFFGGGDYLRHIKPILETPLKREENLN